MGLKAVLTNLDGLSDDVKSLYEKKDDGNFYLQVEGLVPKAKVDEFRNNNIDLSNQLVELKKELEKFKDIDPVKYAEYKDKVQKIQDKKLIDEGKIEELLSQRTEKMRQDFETQKKALETATIESKQKYEEANNRLNDLLINTEITKAAGEGKVKSSAVPDVINRGRSVFKLEDEKILPYDLAGNLIYGKDGTEPLTIKEWVSGLVEQAPHLFEESAGGNAKGGTAGNRSINAKDSVGLSQNLEDIANGKIAVSY